MRPSEPNHPVEDRAGFGVAEGDFELSVDVAAGDLGVVIDDVEGDVLGVIPRLVSGGGSACEIQGRQLVGRITAIRIRVISAIVKIEYDMTCRTKEWQKDEIWAPDPTSEMKTK